MTAVKALLKSIAMMGLLLASLTASDSTVKNVLLGVVAKLGYLLIALRSSIDKSIITILAAVMLFTVL